MNYCLQNLVLFFFSLTRQVGAVTEPQLTGRWFTVWLELEGGEGISCSLGSHFCISLNTEDFFHRSRAFEHRRAHVKLISHPGCDHASWGFQHFRVVASRCNYTYSLPLSVTARARARRACHKQVLWSEVGAAVLRAGREGLVFVTLCGCWEHSTVQRRQIAAMHPMSIISLSCMSHFHQHKIRLSASCPRSL